ncbi:hypothetical protein ACFL5M_05090 [Candidatus Neomarinimicrobiota bacterium]
MKYNLRNIVLVSMILALIQLSWGTTPTLITYQGVLKDSNGDIVADGSYSVIFRLYDVDTGGTDIGWSETHSVTTTDGIFSVVLGDALAGGQSFFGGGIAPFDVPYWLEIEIGGTVMAPRTRLTSVPYANAARSVAGSWNELGSRSRLGINTGSFADTTKAVVITQEGRVGIGTTQPTHRLHIATPHGDGIQLTDSISGTWRASLINFENSGGNLYLNDATGAAQARIRGYEMNGVQGFFNAGRIGIGTTSPQRALHVYSDSSAYIKVSGDSNPYNYSGLILEAVTDNRAWSLVHRSQTGRVNNLAIQQWDGSYHYPFTITPGRKVGIGTEYPSATLEVVGSVKADTVLADTLLLTTPASRYYSIPNAAFEAADDGYNYSRSSQYLYMETGFGTFYAPIHLPDGSTIKELRIWYWDNVDTTEITSILYQMTLSSGGVGNYGTIITSGLSASVRNSALPVSLPVDNQNYAYYVYVNLPPGINTRLNAARIRYEITSPLP